MRLCLIVVFLLSLAAPNLASAKTINGYENLHTALRKSGNLIPEVQVANRSDQDEMLCMALNIYHEVRGQPANAQWAVGFVTWNRTKAAAFRAKSVCAAVWAPGQFSWTRWSVRAQMPREQATWAECQRKAALLVRGGKMNDPTNGSTYFYQARLNPGWAHRLVAKIRIGAHVFARLPGSS